MLNIVEGFYDLNWFLSLHGMAVFWLAFSFKISFDIIHHEPWNYYSSWYIQIYDVTYIKKAREN